MLRKNVPSAALDIMMVSLSESSIKQYDTCLKKWYNFCLCKSIDMFRASASEVILFLTTLFESGAQYGTLNSCRSALALILYEKIGDSEVVKRFFKGVFRLRPPLPKYNITWDKSVVLNRLASWYPNDSLGLDKLSRKLVTLLSLVTAHRMQTLEKININNIQNFPDKITIKIPEIIKTSKIGTCQPNLILPYYREKPEICAVLALLAYLERTSSLRGNIENLFISLRKPHKLVSAQTLARWVKLTLGECGVDISIFTAHSTRHASTSKAHKLGINLEIIRKTAGWSGSSQVFGKFYNRKVQIDKDDSFGRSILNNSNVNS